MGNRVFLRKKFSDYLGENRAILDVISKYEILPSPTPSGTPSTTPTPTPTPSVTGTLTPTPTPTNVFICENQLEVTNSISANLPNGFYQRVLSTTGGTSFQGGYAAAPGLTEIFIPGPDSQGNTWAVFTQYSGSVEYTIVRFDNPTGSTTESWIAIKSIGSFVDNTSIIDGISLILPTSVGGVLKNGINYIAPYSYVNGDVTYTSPCPSVTPTPTVTRTPTLTPTNTPTPTKTLVSWSMGITNQGCCYESMTGLTATIDYNGFPQTLNLTTTLTQTDDTLYKCISVVAPANGVVYDFELSTLPTDYELCANGGPAYDRVRWTVSTQINPTNWNATLDVFSGATLITTLPDTINIGSYPGFGSCTDQIRPLSFNSGPLFYVSAQGILGAENGDEIATENNDKIQIEQCP